MDAGPLQQSMLAAQRYNGHSLMTQLINWRIKITITISKFVS